MNESKVSQKKDSNFKQKGKVKNPKRGSRPSKECLDNKSEQRGYIRDNDPSWYTSYPGIYSATANINFNQPVGVGLNLTEGNDQAYNVLNNKLYVPNVMRFRVALCPGVTTDASSIINTAMFQNYNFVRHANSGSKNYDAVDLQMYYLAVDEALAALWCGIRAYGTMNAFSALNRAIPRTLFKAYGFNYESWVANPAQVRARLNLCATKMASLCVPQTVALNARHQSLFQNVFMDGESIKGQMYVFVPGVIHMWGRVSQVGSLTAKDFVASTSLEMTADQYFDFMDKLLQPLLEDEDINIMSGDVLKAYGSDNLMKVPMLGEDYATPIMTSASSPYMMSQIENAVWLNYDRANLNITQSADGHIEFAPEIGIQTTDLNSIVASLPNLLNARGNEVTNDDVVELTRLHPVFSSRYATEGADKVMIRVRSCGTELPLSAHIFTFTGSAIEQADLWSPVHGAIQNFPINYFNFDWAPILYIGALVPSGEKIDCGISNVIGDLANFTTVSKNVLDLIHDTCVASEFLVTPPKSQKY